MTLGGVISLRAEGQWSSVLQHLDSDIYFDAAFHRAHERHMDGQAMAYVAHDGDEIFFYPFMLRPVRSIAGAAVPDGCCDIESVYGYSGPLSTCSDPAFLRAAWSEFDQWCDDRGVVCEFVRFHPLLENHGIAPSGMDVRRDRDTVVVRLDQGRDAIGRGYTSTQRNRVKKARKLGVTCRMSTSESALRKFIEIYAETMAHVGASSFYAFPDCYFADLCRGLNDRIVVFLAEKDGEPIAAAMFLMGPRVLHYHLGGSRPAGRSMYPNNLLFHEAAEFGERKGLRALFLGGGRTPVADDSLLRFKSRFSPDRVPFYLGSRIRRRTMYNELCELWRRRSGRDAPSGYLQAYRLDVGSQRAKRPFEPRQQPAHMTSVRSSRTGT